MSWGLVNDANVCTGVIVGAKPADRCYRIPDGTPVKAGYAWTGTDWEAPRWSAYEFLKRFSWQERAAIRIASANDNAVADFLQLCTAAQIVIADDPTTVAGMDYLVSLNLLTPARRAEILS